MPRLKSPTLILAFVFVTTWSSQTYGQPTSQSTPQQTSAQQAAENAAKSAAAAKQAASDAQNAANALQAGKMAQEAARAAKAASDAAAAAKSAKDPQDAAKDAQQAAIEAQKAETAAAEAQKAATAPAIPKSIADLVLTPTVDCPAGDETRVSTVDHWWRSRAGQDYIKLEYDVSRHQMRWFDYKHKGNPAGIEVLNGSILPVVYSREKVLVHVNCLHPTDTVSISTNDIAMPEQGADYRGLTSTNTVTALAPTLDSLGMASAAGIAVGTPGFAFGPPPTLASGTTSLFTPGTSKDGTTYTDAVINIAPEDLAIETGALINDVVDAIHSFNELETGKQSKLTAEDFQKPDSNLILVKSCSTLQTDPDLPGSVCRLQTATLTLLGRLSQPPSPNDESLSAFNDYLAQTQTLVSQLNGFASGMNQAGLPARAISIRQNMEAIVGVLAQVANAIADDKRYNGNSLGFLDTQNKITTSHTCGDLYNAIHDKNILDGTIPNPDAKKPGQPATLPKSSNPADTPICHAMEQNSMEQFLVRYYAALDKTKKSSVNVMTALVLRSSSLLEESLNKIGDSPLKSQFTNNLHSFDPNAADVTKFAAIADGAAKLAEESGNKTGTSALSTFSEVLQPQLQRLALYPTGTPPTPTTGTAPTPSSSSWDLGTDKTLNAANQLFRGLLDMRSEVASLDQTVGKVFDKMNNRYQETWVEQTDALPPLTSNTIVRLGINVQRNYTPFTLTGGATVGTAAAAASTQLSASASPAGGGGQQSGGQQAGSKGSQSAGQQSPSQSPSTSPSGAASTTGSNDFTVLMEVHRLADFNLVGGVMAIHVKNYSFASVPEYASFTAGSGISTGTMTSPQYTYTAYVTCPPGTMVIAGATGAVPINATSTSASVTPSPSLYYCLQQTQTASLQPAGMVGIAWFPLHKDYFSRGRGTLFQARNLIPSFMVASSVTSLGSVFLGPNFEPFNGLDLFAGWATSNVTGLAKGTSLNQVLLPSASTNAAPTINTATHVKGGITFGVGFDINVFLQLFGKAQGPSLP